MRIAIVGVVAGCSESNINVIQVSKQYFDPSAIMEEHIVVHYHDKFGFRLPYDGIATRTETWAHLDDVTLIVTATIWVRIVTFVNDDERVRGVASTNTSNQVTQQMPPLDVI